MSEQIIEKNTPEIEQTEQPKKRARKPKEQQPTQGSMNVSEVLTLANTKSTAPAIIKVLREHDSRILRYVLQAGYDLNVATLLPEGEPPFTPENENKLVDLSYYEKQFFMFFRHGPGEKMTTLQREQMFIRMLETLKDDESKLFILAKDQRIQSEYRKITPQIVKEFLSDTVSIRIETNFQQQNRRAAAKKG